MSTPIEMMDVLWSEGKHSLCTQVNGQPFRSVGQFDDPIALFEAAAALPAEANVWWGVHGMDPPAKGRGGVEHVVQVATLCADFDWDDSDAHKGAELPSEEWVRATVAGMSPKPTVVVDSGHGLQAYWGLVDPLDRDEGQRLSEGFFRWVESTYELRNDRVDLASILRLPGSTNNKATPKPVRIEYVDPESGYMTDWLFENCWEPEPLRSVPLVPSVLPVSSLVRDVPRETFDGETPFEWLNSTYDTAAALRRLGWTEERTRGNEQQWTRPGKDPRHGTSATLHLDTGAVNIYSTSLDPIYHAVGKPGRGCVTLKPADLWMVENGITDQAQASSIIRREMMPARGPGVQAPGPTQSPEAVGVPTSRNLPDEFWESRPYLTYIRDAAYSRRVSPDALLVAVMARYAALIPAEVQIPAYIGSTATFDFISCVVAKSAGGKTIANGVAAEIIHTTDERIMLSAPIGSGEGLIQAFMGREKDEKGKASGDQSYKFGTLRAIHFEADEATALMQQQARQGTTIIQTLCTAWSGGTLGQLNSSEEKKRVIPAKKRRISACLNIQTLRGHELLADSLTAVGFPQRILFGWAHSPLPDVIPDWPGQLRYTVPSAIQEIRYAPEIIAEVQALREAVMTERVVLDDLEGHEGLLKLKVAGILTMLGGTDTVTTSDWDLAEHVLRRHRAVRQTLADAKRDADHRHTEASAARAGLFEATKDEVKERKLVTRMADSIIAKVTKEGTPRGQLRKKVTSSQTRHRFDPALEQAIERGAVVVEDDAVFRV